jgi:hypothetical protein
MTEADVIVFGQLENARQKGNGLGETDLTVLEVLKPHPLIKGRKVLTLPRYLPRPDPKKPYTFVVSGKVKQNQLDFQEYVEIENNPRSLAYIRGCLKHDPKKPVEMLRYYLDHLEDSDQMIATDAFTELTQASDAVRDQAARTLTAKMVWTWLRNPKIAPERRSIYAFLLAGCGNPGDAEELFQELDTEGGKVGYFYSILSLKPSYGAKVKAIVGNRRLPFVRRYAVLNATQRLHETQPAAFREAQALDIMEGFLGQPDMADFAVEDFRKWKRWEYTDRILALYGKPGYKSPIVRRSILRFALQSPIPQAGVFVRLLRQQDAEWVEETEEILNAAPK